MDELCRYLNTLPLDAICLLPTRYLCDSLNTAMLQKIDSDEICLTAEDEFECAKSCRKRVNKLLNDDNKVSNTAGIERVIVIKIGSKIMIRRNIDVANGIVNGTIGTVTSVTRSSDGKSIEFINITTLFIIEISISKVEFKFQVCNRIMVHRKQFPITSSYGITIHKCQGLILHCVVTDIGTNIFEDGQVYVALSRVSKLEGLHRINFNPTKFLQM